MGLISKEILSKVIEMDMEFGNLKVVNSNIKDIICLIENMVMEYMIGEITQFIKDSTWKISGQVRESCTLMDSSYTKDFGKMEKEHKFLILK